MAKAKNVPQPRVFLEELCCRAPPSHGPHRRLVGEAVFACNRGRHRPRSPTLRLGNEWLICLFPLSSLGSARRSDRFQLLTSHLLPGPCTSADWAVGLRAPAPPQHREGLPEAADWGPGRGRDCPHVGCSPATSPPALWPSAFHPVKENPFLPDS